VCLTTDGWTSRTNQSFISVTAYFIDPKNETVISSVLLGCIEFGEKHTSENLANFLRNLVEEWNLLYKLTAVITDNAANIKSAIRRCNWRWLSCFAHSINLIVQCSLNCIDSTLSKVKTIV
jgi:predicted DNA-binding ribbon-helix-helix protein